MPPKMGPIFYKTTLNRVMYQDSTSEFTVLLEVDERGSCTACHTLLLNPFISCMSFVRVESFLSNHESDNLIRRSQVMPSFGMTVYLERQVSWNCWKAPEKLNMNNITFWWDVKINWPHKIILKRACWATRKYVKDYKHVLSLHLTSLYILYYFRVPWQIFVNTLHLLMVSAMILI